MAMEVNELGFGFLKTIEADKLRNGQMYINEDGDALLVVAPYYYGGYTLINPVNGLEYAYNSNNKDRNRAIAKYLNDGNAIEVDTKLLWVRKGN